MPWGDREGADAPPVVLPLVLRSRPRPSTPGTSVTLPDGVGQVTSSREPRPPCPTPGPDLSSGCGSRYVDTSFLTLQVGRQRPGGSRALVPPVVTLSWLLPQPRVDMCILICCPGTLSRVCWGGGWRGGVDGGWRLGWGGVQVLAWVMGTWGAIHWEWPITILL